MKEIIECVPNFSEGRNEKIIEAIAVAIRQTDGCTLLDVDPGKSTNRTVYTFVGNKTAVVEGAFNAARVAKALIDMRQHSGEHPRMGAMDVCPFIPVSNATMDDCVDCSISFAKKASEELDIPIYLYEFSQPTAYRKKLPIIREGEYETLPERIVQEMWKPDYGPAKFVPSWGATVTGARTFLIAYNINILGTKEQAFRIALNIRENGRNDGTPGLLKECKAIGWFVDEYNLAQISINLNDYTVTSIHQAFETCKKEAAQLQVAITGSELVGLVPKAALLDGANFYMQKEHLMIADETQQLKLVVDRLGLNAITPFIPEKRIIEYLVEDKHAHPLANSPLSLFIQQIAARTSAPGGGSVSATMASMGTALACMVAQLTYGVRKFDSVDLQMRECIPVLHELTQALIPMIDADTNAFNDYVEAMRLPKTTELEKNIRDKAMQNGLKKAIEIPLAVMRLSNKAWQAMAEVAKYGNIASRSDIEVGAKALESGIWGAHKNVIINMNDITDMTYKQTVLKEADTLLEHANMHLHNVLNELEKR